MRVSCCRESIQATTEGLEQQTELGAPVGGRPLLTSRPRCQLAIAGKRDAFASRRR